MGGQGAAFRLTYVALLRVLGWFVLLTRSDTTKHRDLRGPVEGDWR
jgi:hypothetical protein